MAKLQLEQGSEDVVPVGTALMEMDEEIFIDLSPDKQDIILKVITEQLGLDLNSEPIREFVMEGTPGTEAKGDIKVTCYITNQPGLSVRRLKYAGGKVSWGIGKEEE